MTRETKDSLIIISGYIIGFIIFAILYKFHIIECFELWMYIVYGFMEFNEVLKYVNHFPSTWGYDKKK